MPIYIGTSGYSYKEWKGSFYPADLPNKSMLRFYAMQFNSVEANSTFRGIPDVSAVRNWMEQVPAQFRFALKAPFQITHQKRLKGVKRPLSAFFAATSVLQRRLGPVLFQFPPNFKKDAPRLRAFLRLLPPRIRAAFEFRHESWFDDEILGLLRGHRAALCIADAEDLAVPFAATTNWGYLRLRREEYSRANLKGWAKRIQDQNWRDAYVYFRHEDEAKGPRFAKQLMQMLA
jgi:uncharacterized protein YecE (DUF72 family)